MDNQSSGLHLGPNLDAEQVEIATNMLAIGAIVSPSSPTDGTIPAMTSPRNYWRFIAKTTALSYQEINRSSTVYLSQAMRLSPTSLATA